MDLYETMRNNFFVIIGMNVIENPAVLKSTVREIGRICDSLDLPYVFKVSFDKANRTSRTSYRGPGIESGLQILREIREEFGCWILTDVHEAWQCEIVAEYADVLQIPAFLCRQTDLVVAAAQTGRIIHVKKGQFCNADTMHACAEKIRQAGNDRIILCERGTMFGYTDLIVDSRNLVQMRGSGLVTMDVTHCLQQPAQRNPDGTISSGGIRSLIPAMCRMAVAVGVNGLFMEVHPDPDSALCDAPTQWYLSKTKELLEDMIGLYRAVSPITHKTYE